MDGLHNIALMNRSGASGLSSLLPRCLSLEKRSGVICCNFPSRLSASPSPFALARVFFQPEASPLPLREDALCLRLSRFQVGTPKTPFPPQ